MVPKTGASLSCTSLPFVFLSRCSRIATQDPVRSFRKIEPRLQKDTFIACRNGACLAQQDDPHLIKKTADSTGCIRSIDRLRDVGERSVVSRKSCRINCRRRNKIG